MTVTKGNFSFKNCREVFVVLVVDEQRTAGVLSATGSPSIVLSQQPNWLARHDPAIEWILYHCSPNLRTGEGRRLSLPEWDKKMKETCK
jgi:hypothetical protein